MLKFRSVSEAVDSGHGFQGQGDDVDGLVAKAIFELAGRDPRIVELIEVRSVSVAVAPVGEAHVFVVTVVADVPDSAGASDAEMAQMMRPRQ